MDFTSTVIGTPHYLSPEILLGQGYSFSCDYWSLGVVIYEMVYKCYPFGGHSKDVMEIYHDIMYSSGFTYPVNKSEYKNTCLTNCPNDTYSLFKIRNTCSNYIPENFYFDSKAI